MSKKKNPQLKEGDRIILIYMPGENLDPGTKGEVVKIEKTPSFGGGIDYQYRTRWFDDDNKVISTLSLIPGSDSWLFDSEYVEKNMNEDRKVKITNLDDLISRHEWSKLFKKTDLKDVMEFLEVIRQLGVVNMFQSGQFLGQTKDYIKKYFDLYRMQHDLDDNQEELIEKVTNMVENVRNIMISSAIKDLERKNKEITTLSVTSRIKLLSNEILRHFMGK